MPQTGPPLRIRPMTQADLADADLLRQQAGWNQTAADWFRLWSYQPDGCFVAVRKDAENGRPHVVGTVTTTSYRSGNAPALAWIGMMLVHSDFRRQGIGSQLMSAALQYLRNSNIDCIRLDATPAGQPVYERLGFQPEFTFHRWKRETAFGHKPVDMANRFQPLISAGAELDLRAFGVDRQEWLQLVAGDSSVIERDESFAMLRNGSLASYLGPVTARNPQVAEQLIDALLSECTEPVFWDILSTNPAAERLAEERGFQRVRELTRMWTGTTQLSAEHPLQFALCDPGTG